jgi:hypothetical protein
MKRKKDNFSPGIGEIMNAILQTFEKDYIQYVHSSFLYLDYAGGQFYGHHADKVTLTLYPPVERLEVFRKKTEQNDS